MARIRIFDLILTATTLAALIFLLPDDTDDVKTDTKIMHSPQPPIHEVTSGNQKPTTSHVLYTT